MGGITAELESGKKMGEDLSVPRAAAATAMADPRARLEAEARKLQEQAAARAQRGRNSLVATGLRGVLTPPVGGLKSLLGE